MGANVDRSYGEHDDNEVDEYDDGDEYGGYDEYWRFDEFEDAATHQDEDLGTHHLFRHWRSLDKIFWAPLWHEDSKGCEAAEAAFSQLTKWGAPRLSTGLHVAAIGSQCAALDGCILLRNPRDIKTERGDIEGAIVIGQQLFRLVCDIAHVNQPHLSGTSALPHPTIDRLKRVLAWQLEFRRPALDERLRRARYVQKCDEAHLIAKEFDAPHSDVWPDGPVSDHLELVEDSGEATVRQAMSVQERFDTARAHLYSIGDHLHAAANCSTTGLGAGSLSVTVTGAELRRRRVSVCEHCAPSIHAALDAMASLGPPSDRTVCVAFDTRRGPAQGRRLGDYLMMSVIPNWAPSTDVMDPVTDTATVSGRELAAVEAYWFELSRRGMISRIVEAA